MMINEPLGNPTDNDVLEEARRLEVDTLAQMKSEFQDFVHQTRERLRSISESLSELDRDYTHAAPVDEREIGSSESIATVSDEKPVHELADVEERPEASRLTIAEPAEREEPSEAFDATVAHQDQNEPLETENEFWFESSSAPNDDGPISKEDASIDASFRGDGHLDTDLSGKRDPDNEIARAAYRGRQAASSSDADSDPMERLNAIKQRLARQIENS